jgi:hypothetical protein
MKLESKGRGTGQHRTHLGIRNIICRTFYTGFRTRGALSCRTGGTGLRFRALDHGAARPRAGRAFTNLAGLGTTGNARRAFRNRGFQNVLRHIRKRRAFCLQHVLGKIGHRRAGRNGGTKNPFARVW